MPRRVRLCDRGTRVVREQCEPLQAQVLAERFDVLGELREGVAGRVGRGRGVAGAAAVRDDQLPVRGHPAEVAQVRGVPPGSAYQAHQGRQGRVGRSEDAVMELGIVVCTEVRHTDSLPDARPGELAATTAMGLVASEVRGIGPAHGEASAATAT